LVSGIAAYLKSVNPSVEIIGVSPANDAAMLASIKAGRIVEVEARPTLSDGTAGGLEPGAITFGLCQQLLDVPVWVSEEEMATTLKDFIETHHLLIEGAAAVALAGLIKVSDRLRGKRVVVIVCGANISLKVLKGL
jgi:threonine dehydratase